MHPTTYKPLLGFDRRREATRHYLAPNPSQIPSSLRPIYAPKITSVTLVYTAHQLHATCPHRKHISPAEKPGNTQSCSSHTQHWYCKGAALVPDSSIFLSSLEEAESVVGALMGGV
jgi:hypothetical protein